MVSCLTFKSLSHFEFIFAHDMRVCYFFFVSNYIDGSRLPCFLDELAKGLSKVFIFPKNQLLVSLIVSIFLVSYLIYFCSDLYVFFPSANLFVLLSLAALD